MLTLQVISTNMELRFVSLVPKKEKNLPVNLSKKFGSLKKTLGRSHMIQEISSIGESVNSVISFLSKSKQGVPMAKLLGRFSRRKSGEGDEACVTFRPNAEVLSIGARGQASLAREIWRPSPFDRRPAPQLIRMSILTRHY